MAKNSTVPKSEIVSIRTRENPPIIAGLAIGRATLKKIEFSDLIEQVHIN